MEPPDLRYSEKGGFALSVNTEELMNKIRKQIGAVLLGVFMLFSSAQQVLAGNAGQAPVLTDEEKTTSDTPVSGLEKVQDSIVQVVIEYADALGNTYILKSGSGFLISPNAVLTNYDMLSLTAEETAAAEAYLSGVLGKPVSFSSAEGAEQISCQLGVVMYRDVIIGASIDGYSSKDMKVGVLNLSDTMNRSTALLGNSDTLEIGRKVYALGYKNVAVMQAGQNAELLSQRDLKINEGILNEKSEESSIQYLNHSAKINRGSIGGPIVDENGTVIGMNTGDRAQDGGYRSLAVNEIKQLLDNCEITYKESGLESMSESDTAGAGNNGSSVDHSLLDDYILNYSLLEKSAYTPESYQVLEAALENARAVKADKTATQDEIDTAVNQLGQAKAGLVAAKNMNWPFIIAMCVIIIAMAAGLVLYILKLKGILFKKSDPERLLTLSEMTMKSRNTAISQTLRKSEPEISIPKPKNSGTLGRSGGLGGSFQETTVLGVGGGEQGTVVLGVSAGAQEVYLVRSSNMEKIRIDGQDFIIGKDRNKANYCIVDNPSISRCHARIQKKNGGCYLSDMKSTNFTYLNNRILMSDEEAELKDGDIIRFSNEEFIFQDT